MRRLVIIDIQKHYKKHFSLKYIRKIKKYLKENRKFYDEIVCLIDLPSGKSEDSIPSFLLEVSTEEPIVKMYNNDYMVNMINKSGEISIRGVGNEYEVYGELLIENKRVLKETKNGVIVGLKKNNNLDLDFIDSHFAKRIKKWKEEDAEITLIGGGLDRCVEKTQKLLDIFEVENVIIEELCYDIKDGRKSSPKELLLDIAIRWSRLFNNNKNLIEYNKKKKRTN